MHMFNRAPKKREAQRENGGDGGENIMNADCSHPFEQFGHSKNEQQQQQKNSK